MEEFKGTKGPWRKDGNHIVKHEADRWNDAETICDLDPTTEYPTVYERNIKESEYNAKLIAAAPELLEVLQEFSELQSTSIEHQELRVKAIQAINKAL